MAEHYCAEPAPFTYSLSPPDDPRRRIERRSFCVKDSGHRGKHRDILGEEW